MISKNIYTYVFIALIFLPGLSFGQKKEIPEVCISGQEQLLYQMINAYRKEQGLEAIPLSKSLTYVAQTHAWDLSEHHPYNKRCNLHSWSDEGPWTGCCYTEDHFRAQCMWDKPRELTNYPGDGYEIAYWTDAGVSPEEFVKMALSGWKKSHDHNVVILNAGRWKEIVWNAVGVGIYDGYAVVWFGKEPDDEGRLEICAE